MKKKIVALVIGGLVTVSAIGFGYSAYAAEKSAEQKPAMHNMMQGGQMGKLDDKAMSDMMKDPEMQVVLKQMLQNDPELHKIMLDLVNSVDMNEHSHDISTTTPNAAQAEDHSAHHQ